MENEVDLVTLPNARVMESHFWISEAPADDMVNRVDASLVDKGVLELDQATMAWVVVSIEVRMTSADDESDVRMRAIAKVRSEVPYREGDDMDVAYISCIREGVSLAASQLHVSTALSPIGLVTIPECDARKILEAATGQAGA